MRGVHLHRGQDGHIEILVPVAGPAHKHDAQSRTPVLGTVSSRAQKKMFQYDPLATPDSILRAAVVLEEAGVTVLSPHNQLVSLHSLLDSGVEVNGLFVYLTSSGSSTKGIKRQCGDGGCKAHCLETCGYEFSG